MGFSDIWPCCEIFSTLGYDIGHWFYWKVPNKYHAVVVYILAPGVA